MNAIKNYIAQGYAVVPIPPRSKGPVLHGWQKLRIESPEGWFGGDSNVGVILGHASGGLICVDLDHPAAVELASQYLPPTGLVAGRGNNGKSHWFYRVSGEFRKVAFSSRCRVKAVEILGDGQQVVVGPSIHPGGDMYELLEGEAEVVGADVITEAARNLAVAVFAKLGIEPEPERPKRNPPNGAQSRNGSDAPTDLRQTLIEHRAEIFGEGTTPEGCAGYYVRCPREDSHTTPNARKDCMVWTGPGGGWQARCMHASCGIDSWAAFRDAIDPIWRPRVSVESNEHGVDMSALLDGDCEQAECDRPAETSLPDACLNAPGLIREIVEYNLRTAKYPQPTLALAGAIVLMATIIGRKVCDGMGTRPNIYAVGVGVSRAGKDHARRINMRILDAVGCHDWYEESLASAAALHKFVGAHPAGLWMIDEMGDFIAASRAKYSGNTQAAQIVSALNKLYSSSGGTYKAARYADNAKQIVVNQPCLSIYGTTTGNVLWKNVQDEHLHGGLFSRLAVFPPIGYVEPRSTLGVAQDVPESIVEQVNAWLAMRAGNGNLADKTPTPAIVPHTLEARERFESHELAIDRRRRSEGELRAAIWSGTAERTAKFALLFACSRSANPLQIMTEDVDRAILLSNLLTRVLVGECDSNVAENQQESSLKRVLKVVSKSGRSGLTRNELTRKTQWLRCRERDEILRDLLVGGQVVSEKKATGGRDAEVFVAVRNIKKEALTMG